MGMVVSPILKPFSQLWQCVEAYMITIYAYYLEKQKLKKTPVESF